MSFPYLGETKELNDVTRKEASGSFIRLPDGVTHYELGGPEGGKPVVLIHGFSVPYYIYDPTFELLTRSGFHVLRYDLLGRGWSDRPRLRYDIQFFVKQLADLLEALRFTQPVNLVGLSMGGPISAMLAVQDPKRVRKLVLIDPVGARGIKLMGGFKVLLLPGIGELALGLAGSESLVKSLATDFFDPALVAEFQERYRVQMQFKGFKRAILSSLRSNMLGSFIEIYRQVGELNTQILLLWGRNDTTVPFPHSEDLLAVVPKVEFHVIENCGHIPHYEKPLEVNPILLEFLRNE